MAKGSGSSKGTSVADAYGEYAASMAAAGVQGLDGRGASSSGKSSSGKSGPSASSPAGGSQAAAGYSGGSRGSTPSHGGGPSPSSPAGGSQAAAGFNGGSSDAPTYGGGGLAQAAGISPPSISARSAETASMAALAGLGGAAGLVPSSVPSARQAEDASMRSLQSHNERNSTYRAAETQSMNRHTALQAALAQIRSAEAFRGRGYNSVQGLPDLDVDLTNMTIAEVQAYQKALNSGPLGKRTSAAVGAYQFIPSTLTLAASKAGLSKDAKFSKAVQDQLAIAMIDHRAEQATRNGKVSLNTFANRLADEWASFANSSGKSAYHGVQGNRASVGFETVRDIARSLVDSGAVGRPGQRSTPAQQQDVQIASANVPTPTSRPEPSDRFAQTYLSPQMAASGGLMPPTAVSRQGDDLNPNRGNPQPGDLARGLGPEPIEAAVQVASAEPAAPSTSFPPAPAAPGQKTGRSVGGRIAAGAIDTATGFIPGVGIAATGFNVLAGLTGNRTIGERAVDLFGRGSGTPGVAPGSEYGGGYDELPPPSIGPKEDKKDDSTRFADTYLAFSDPTQRPTPREKWSRATA